MRKQISSLLAAAALVLGLTGCFFEPYQEVSRYEPPVTRQIASPLRATEFTDISGVFTAYRTIAPDGRVSDDSRFKWVLPPGELVSRALNRCFTGDGTRRLTGTLDTFAESNGQFVCAGTFCIDNRNYRFRCTAPVTDASPAARAGAAASCIEKLAAEAAAAARASGESKAQ